MTRSVLLVSNRGKPGVADALPEVRALLSAHARLVGELDGDATIPPGGLPHADLVVVLGGDGTLLAQARRFADMGAPLLGVNFGKVGFLAEFDLPSLRAQAPAILAAPKLPVRERLLLGAEVHRAAGGPPHRGIAINECVITAGPPYRMIGLDIAIDGEPGPSLTGDGVIIATPLGSTAYNVSAGGPIVSPEVQAFIITPLAAHSLSFRPIVAPHTSTIAVTVTRSNRPAPGDSSEPEAGTTLVLDGQEMVALGDRDRVMFRRGAKPARMVVNSRTSYWRTLIGKMHWAAAPGPGPRLAPAPGAPGAPE